MVHCHTVHLPLGALLTWRGTMCGHRYGKGPYCSVLTDEHAKVVTEAESSPSLLKLIERWLERSPFLSAPGAAPSLAALAAP